MKTPRLSFPRKRESIKNEPFQRFLHPKSTAIFPTILNLMKNFQPMTSVMGIKNNQNIPKPFQRFLFTITLSNRDLIVYESRTVFSRRVGIESPKGFAFIYENLFIPKLYNSLVIRVYPCLSVFNPCPSVNLMRNDGILSRVHGTPAWKGLTSFYYTTCPVYPPFVIPAKAGIHKK